MSCVKSINIEAWFRLSVTGSLGIVQDHIKGEPLIFHAGEDIVAGSVQNAVHALNLIANQPVLQRAQHRNASAHARFKKDARPALRGHFKQFAARFSQQCFIGCNHRLTVLQCAQNKFLGNLDAADQLNDYVDFRIVDHRKRVGR